MKKTGKTTKAPTATALSGPFVVGRKGKGIKTEAFVKPGKGKQFMHVGQAKKMKSMFSHRVARG